MTYFKSDAELVERLESEIEALGLPILMTRKINGILNAIEMQIEDEYANPIVVDTLYIAMQQFAAGIPEPTCDRIIRLVEQARSQMSKRLLQRMKE